VALPTELPRHIATTESVRTAVGVAPNALLKKSMIFIAYPAKNIKIILTESVRHLKKRIQKEKREGILITPPCAPSVIIHLLFCF
ncbi:MAG: hypothetical protein KKF80_01475, partial [Candidatus Omnitrophica bacterium]|nr:hypothetical protein [Candidatus Omnitrophota bacterium]